MNPFQPPLVGIIGRTFLITSIVIFLVSSSLALDPPKIGLVLSGGGAKGLAHIGILKALEEAGITPDYITGTSMGSIMGGLYASGYSADEIKTIVLGADWDQLLTNKIKLNEVVYEEKDYYNRYINELNIDGFNFELPKGLIEGQKLSMLLSNLTRPVMNIRDFSQLPIPYACIGADIENGEKVVLNKGSLARSMRASMAIPSVFTPVTIDNRLLVDGGLVHNFPVEEAIDMGADYIIGVFVGTNLLKKEEIGSPLSVLTQSAFIHSAFDTEIQRKLVDLYIEPDMTGFTPGDFHRAEAIIAVGEKYGQLFLERFKAINDSIKALGHINRKVVKPRVSDSLQIARISVLNNENVPSRFITDRLDIDEQTTISMDALEKGIVNLYGTGYFTKILYEIKDSDEGSELILDISESPEGKIRSAIQYDTETKISVLVNLTYRNLLLNNSRILLEGEISENPLLDVNYLKYFGDRQKFGFNTGYYFRNAEVPQFDEEVMEGLLEYNFNRYYASFLSSHRINRMLKLSYSYETAGLKPEVGSDILAIVDKIKFNSHNLEAMFDYNSMDDRYFPNQGNHYGIMLKYTVAAKTRFDLILADTLDPVRLEFDNTGSLTANFYHSMVLPVYGKFTFGMENAFYLNWMGSEDSLALGAGFLNENYIGGFRKLAPNLHPFWGAEPSRYYAENLYYNELWLRYEPLRNLYFQAGTQFYHPNYPLALLFPEMKERDYYFGGKKYLFGFGAAVSYRSPAGPLTFAVGKGNTDAKLQYFLNLGFYFDRR